MDQIYQLLAIMLGAILANNFIFSQFLGICPFLGVSKKLDSGASGACSPRGMRGAFFKIM